MMADADCDQAGFAKLAGINASNLSQWMRGATTPETDSLQKLARAGGKSLSWLLGETGIESAPVEEAVKPVDRRTDIPVFHIASKAEGRAIPKWLGMAAGEGSDLELSDEFIYVERLRNASRVHSAVIKGDSMLNTLFPGDVVLLEEIPPEGRLPLPQIETRDAKTTLSKWKRDSGVKDDDIVVVSIRDSAPTIKRIVYDTERGEADWKLQIVADNPPAWRNKKPFQVGVGDSVVFHAKLIGRVEGLKQ